MADVRKEVMKKQYADSLITIREFRAQYADNVTPQAINYAIDKGLIDHIEVGPRVRIIVLTERTKNYSPNSSEKRRSVANL